MDVALPTQSRDKYFVGRSLHDRKPCIATCDTPDKCRRITVEHLGLSPFHVHHLVNEGAWAKNLNLEHEEGDKETIKCAH